MQAGKRNRHCVIERRSDLQDGYGEAATQWVAHAIRWSYIRPLNGNEVVQAKQVGSNTTHEITMLYCEGINPDMRLICESRVFHIRSVLDVDERHKEHVLRCEEALNV